MFKKKIAIRFKNIHQLWAYAHQIRVVNIEIITTEMTLICDCTDQDLEGLLEYGGEIIQEYHRNSKQQSINQN
ncbi:MAG TPA: hypothetical protein VNS32_20760 [Flavisolibacter sp.]|nr:hypothetical protein [Flavisolibacter sp.]